MALRNQDVNLDEGYLIVKDAKNGKERMLPLSDSLSEVCRRYVHYRSLLPFDSTANDYFFVTPTGNRCKRERVYRRFREILWKAGIPHSGHGPRVHDLRHTFSVHSLAMMADSGVDLYCSLPTLSTYLGHQSLSATNGYVRLTSEMYPGLLKDVDLVCLNVFPNSEYYETN